MVTGGGTALRGRRGVAAGGSGVDLCHHASVAGVVVVVFEE